MLTPIARRLLPRATSQRAKAYQSPPVPTQTQITTTVPSGAISGPITVTTPSGSATSSTNFTVGTTNGGPTITGFTPNIGIGGTSVTINGTSFDLAKANDRLTFNIAPAVTSSVTNSNQIGTTVPSTAFSWTSGSVIPTSGRLSISTPTGSATSSQDFYVPYLGHLVGDI